MVRAVLDACVLYPASLRDSLLSVAAIGCFSPVWSQEICDEWEKSLLEDRPDLTSQALEKTRKAMNDYFPYAKVDGFQGSISNFSLPDEKDRHVLALAIHAASPFIVTNNLSDFPKSILSLHGVEAISPDDFFVMLIQTTDILMVEGLAIQRKRLSNPPKSVDKFLEKLNEIGLPRTVRLLDSKYKSSL